MNDNAPNDKDLRQSASIPTWAAGLCAIVVLVATFASVGVLFMSQASILQSRLAITFLCFAVSCVIGLLFASTASQSEIRGQLGAYSLVLIGPGAFFIASLAIFAQIFPENNITQTDPLTLRKFQEIIRDVEKRSEWSTYSEWKRELHQLWEPYDRFEHQNIKRMLWYTNYFADDDRKLKTPLIQTLFVFPTPKSPGIKLQRISGAKVEGTDVPRVYFAADSTGPRPQTVMLERRVDKTVKAHRLRYPARDTGLAKSGPLISSDPVDCLVLATYPVDPADEPDPGDFLAIDLPKYFQRDTGNATVDFALLSKMPATEVRLWEVRTAGAAAGGEVPLLFRQFSSSPRNDLPELQNSKELISWLKYLDCRANAHKLRIGKDNPGKKGTAAEHSDNVADADDYLDCRVDDAKSGAKKAGPATKNKADENADELAYADEVAYCAREFLRDGTGAKDLKFECLLNCDELKERVGYRLNTVKNALLMGYLWGPAANSRGQQSAQ